MTDFKNELKKNTEMCIELRKRSKELFCDAARTFMEKYKTDHICFDLDDDFPSAPMTMIDDHDHDLDIYIIYFNEDGSIRFIGGHDYYRDEDYEKLDLFSFPRIGDYYDEITKCIVQQIENGRYIEEVYED